MRRHALPDTGSRQWDLGLTGLTSVMGAGASKAQQQRKFICSPAARLVDLCTGFKQFYEIIRIAIIAHIWEGPKLVEDEIVEENVSSRNV